MLFQSVNEVKLSLQALLMALETQVQVQNAQKMSARLWTWLGKEALDAKVAHVPGPQCLRVAMTLPPEPEGRTLGERPWQDDLPSPDPEVGIYRRPGRTSD